MDTTPGKRLLEWREFKGITLAEMSRITGIRTSTLSSTEQPGSSNPSYDTITKVLAGFPDLNPDWLLLGNGPMLRDGRSLTPAAPTEEPAPAAAAEPQGFYSGPATVDYADSILLREQMQARIDGLEEDKSELRQEVRRLRDELGKPFNGLDAAGTPTPTPRTPIGFALSVSHRVKSKGAARPL